jgi:hypothetical protein
MLSELVKDLSNEGYVLSKGSWRMNHNVIDVHQNMFHSDHHVF